MNLRNTIQSLLPVQIFLCYCFCISGFLINFIQLLTWIFIWPFHQRLYRRINYYLATLIWSRKFDIFFIEITLGLELTFLYSWWSNSDLIIYVDRNDLEHLKHEYALNLVNHRYEIDWLIGLVTAQRLGLLGVNFIFIY